MSPTNSFGAGHHGLPVVDGSAINYENEARQCPKEQLEKAGLAPRHPPRRETQVASVLCEIGGPGRQWSGRPAPHAESTAGGSQNCGATVPK